MPTHPENFQIREEATYKAIERVNRENEANTRLLRDHVHMRGGLQLQKRDKGGKTEIVLDDRNLIVSIGRRLFSRLISGGAGSPTILRGQQYGLRVIRSTTGSPTAAWVTFSQVAGTNEFLFELYTNSGREYFWQFTAGQQTLTTLAAAISGQAGWKADVMNSLGSVDATLLAQTPRADALGSAASYTNGWTSNYTRRLAVGASIEQVLTPNVTTPIRTAEPLIITGIRFGTGGHDLAVPSTGKPVLATDEYLTSMLRASDISGANEGQDLLPIQVTYPSPAQVAFTAVLPASEANGLNLSEASLVAAGDFQVARKNFGQILKTNSFDFIAKWTLIF